jgi:hypothetical protein
LSYGLNKEKEIKMRIQELLNDDQLYEIWLLLTDQIWEALIANYSNNEVAEGYLYRRPVLPTRSRPARTINRKPTSHIVPVKPFPTRPELKTAKNSMSSKSQTTGTNPKVDPLKGYIAKLDNRNVFPLISKKDIEIERKRPDGR